ncbi:MAG: sigma-70 family RNA polymerase sigma factor [Clostridia bacterium]|nr:sigma-70 family RNA polymerase sigma factor [Clostridia bacterium]
MQDFDDIELIKRIKDGDTDAMDALIRRYMGAVRGMVRKSFLVGGEEEDLFQEGLIAIISAVKQYDESKKCSFSTYVNTCVRSRIIDAIRSATRQKHRALNDSLPLSDEMDSTRTYVDPVEIYIKRERVDAFYQNLEKMLSPLQNEILKLYFDGYSYSEIAGRMSLPIKKIDNSLNTIKNKIRKQREKFESVSRTV